MGTKTTDAVLSMPLKLLWTINRFAYGSGGVDPTTGQPRDRFADTSDRRHLAGVHVTKSELVATNGHRIVIVPLSYPCFGRTGTFDESFTIPRWIIDAANAAAADMGCYSETKVQLSRPPKGHPEYKMLALSFGKPRSADKRNNGAADAIVMMTEAITESYPPWEQLLGDGRKGDVPPVDIRFDPHIFGEVGDVLQLLGEKYGIQIRGWGDAMSPFQLYADGGVRVIVMPMRGPEAAS